MFSCTKNCLIVGRLAPLLVFGFIIVSLFSLYHSSEVPTALWFSFKQKLTPFNHGHRVEPAIPAIVHFVQLKENPGSQLHFSFEAFLALYAAHLHIHPTTIFVHHDFSSQEVANATEHGSSWTKSVLTAIPSVRLNPVTAPTVANEHNITRVEHRSDFVRLEQLQQHGGVYLDWDVVTLRPLAHLRHAGYRAVVGRQFDAFVNNGIILATPASAVVRILHREALRVFDGGWITHSVKLLTHVANRLAAAPGEVLIMDFKAFSPFSWEQESVNQLLRRHVGDAVPWPKVASLQDSARIPADQLWETRTSAATDQKKWVYDFSDVVFLHKIFNSVDSPPGYKGVNVPYILARDSNYAVATWDIVMNGIAQGVINEHDESY